MPLNRERDRVQRVGAENSAEKVVTAATTLSAVDTVVKATIPLASENSYNVTLPPVGSCPDQRFLIYFKRATGVYVDGAVTVVSQSDGLAALTVAAKTNTGFVVVENIGGKLYRLVVDSTEAVPGLGISEAELAVLDGVTPGTTAAGKVVTTAAGTNKVASLDITDLKVGGTSVTSTAAELNKLHNIGAVIANAAAAAANVADLAENLANDANGTAIASAVNANAAAINDIKAALVSFGIMAAGA